MISLQRIERVSTFHTIVHRKFKMRPPRRTGFVRAGREFWRKLTENYNQSRNRKVAKSSQSPLRKQGNKRNVPGLRHGLCERYESGQVTLRVLQLDRFPLRKER